MKKNKNVDKYFEKLTTWQQELTELRNMLLNTELVEDFKWYHPCYTYNGINVVILGHFKNYCTISFFKGALIKDNHDLLVKPGANTQSDRVIKINDFKMLEDNKTYILDYINQAIDVEKKGLKYDFKPTKEYTIPEELTKIFGENRELKAYFYKLTPGRQHAYLLYFASAKQSSTRIKRIMNSIDKIKMGEGPNEDYMKAKSQKNRVGN